MKKDNWNGLEETLKELGIADVASMNLEIIEYSSADAEKNKQVYEKTNQLLLSTVKDKELDECFHLTGEMRAIADPMHRQVCRELWKRYKKRVTMLCYLPPEYRTTGRKILEWNRQNWGKVPWVHHLDALDLIGSAEIDLIALQELEKVHYSVFDNRLVLLQAHHEHRVHEKDVWLIDSEFLNKVLTRKVKKIKEKGEYINPNIFKDLTLSISDPIALQILFSLYETEKIRKEDFYLQFNDVKKSFILNLSAMGFIQEFENFVQITKSGKEYLNLFL